MNDQSITIVTCTCGPGVHGFAPRRDMTLFEDLVSDRRSVKTVEAVVPARFRQLPFSSRWWVDHSMWRVCGWTMQQLTKLSANHAVDSKLILFAGSDVTFIRPFQEELYYTDGQLRLHHVPEAAFFQSLPPGRDLAQSGEPAL